MKTIQLPALPNGAAHIKFSQKIILKRDQQPITHKTVIASNQTGFDRQVNELQYNLGTEWSLEPVGRLKVSFEMVENN